MKRKYVLNEDIDLDLDDLEALIVDDGIANSDDYPHITPEQVDMALEEPTDKQENIGISQMISDLIKDEWEAIDGYKSTIATLQSLGGNEELIKVMEDISKEEMVHVGQLEECLKKVSPEAVEIETGHEEAEEQIDSSVEEPKEEITEDYGDGIDFSEFDFRGKGYEDYMVYWMDEALSEINYLREDGDDEEEDVQLLRALSNDGIEDLCKRCANYITNSDYIWEQINDTIHDAIAEELRDVFNDDIDSSEITLDNTEGE